jgi:hypothetical protein
MADEAAESPDSGLRSFLQKAAYVVAPGTVVVGLLYYFGSTYTAAYYSYFGVPLSDLQFSVQGYLANSPSAIFFPVWIILCCGLLFLLMAGMLERRLVKLNRDGVRRSTYVRILSVGICLLLVGFLVFLGPSWWSNSVVHRIPSSWAQDLVPPLVVGAGAATAAFAIRLRAGSRTSSQDPDPADEHDPDPVDRFWTVAGALLLAMLTMSLFFAGARYAGDAGNAQAKTDAANGFPGRNLVLIYSKAPIVSDAQGILFDDLGASAGSFRFRYRGFVILAKSGSRYYLVSHTWTPDSAVTVELPDDGTVRVELRGMSNATGWTSGRTSASSKTPTNSESSSDPTWWETMSSGVFPHRSAWRCIPSPAEMF